MNKKFFIMQLKGDIYTISSNKNKNIANTKMTNEVKQLSTYSWSCTNKQSLIEFAKHHKEESINKLKIKLEEIKSRQILCE